MFGIGKKSEKVKTGAKGEKKGAEDEIQFEFEENDRLPFDDDEDFVDEDFVDEDFVNEPSRKGMRQPLSQRTLLLVLLLLLALGGGGYYYLNRTSVPSSPEPSAPVTTRVQVQPESPVPVVVTPVPVAVTPAQEAQPATSVPEPASATKAVAETTPAPDTAAAVPSEPKRATASKPVSQPYTLAAGAFVSQKNQQDVERKIRRLGYTPQVRTVDTMVPMTRLLLGIYDDPAAAQARRQELSAQLPGLFTLQQGEKVALYAGSFQNLDQARRLADQLYLRGILADEETITLPMSLKKISFGSFSSRAEAEKAAKRAAAAGLTAQVAKR